MTPEQEAEVLRLRHARVGTKQIARKLGIRPAAVTAVIRANTADLCLPLHECLVNTSAYGILLTTGSKRQAIAEESGANGFAQVIVSRKESPQRYLVGSYLVDYWCLGVKDVVPPRTMGHREYELFQEHSRSRFDESHDSISLEQAQSIVFGSMDYAQQLGLSPCNGFNDRAQRHMGGRPESLIPIEFGQDGQPFYISGPYDNAEKIIATLTEKVGEGNFRYVMSMGEPISDEFYA